MAIFNKVSISLSYAGNEDVDVRPDLFCHRGILVSCLLNQSPACGEALGGSCSTRCAKEVIKRFVKGEIACGCEGCVAPARPMSLAETGEDDEVAVGGWPVGSAETDDEDVEYMTPRSFEEAVFSFEFSRRVPSFAV
jgi:hypothetical protein